MYLRKTKTKTHHYKYKIQIGMLEFQRLDNADY